MKNNSQSSLYFSATPLKAVHTDFPEKQTQYQSPYLRAILSSNPKVAVPENDLPVVNPDKAAALRYIKESSSSKK